VQYWLAGQLAQTYSDLCVFGAGVVQKRADQGLLLPVLDAWTKYSLSAGEGPFEWIEIRCEGVREPAGARGGLVVHAP
jgi:hypothetical protein